MSEALMMRAWSVLELKAVEGPTKKRLFTGTASTPATDRMGDIVEPKGAIFKLPIPLLWQHASRDPVGWIHSAKVTKDGISVEGEVAQIDEPGPLQERLATAWQMLKIGLVRGLSIGFAPKESEPISPKEPWGPQRFLSWEWLELSAVTIPANQDANITSIKSIDEQLLAASGRGQKSSVVVISPPGASGQQQNISTQSKGKTMTTQEMIAGLEAKRAATAARIQKLVELSSTDGSTFTAEQDTEFDEAKAELDKIDKHLERMRDAEKVLIGKATPVLNTDGTAGDDAKGKLKAGDFVIKPNANLPPGIGMARYVKAFAFAKGNYQQAAEYAKQWDDSTPEVALALKTAVSAGTTTDSTWAGPLVYAQDFPAAFLEYLRPKTIIGKMQGIARVPFNIRYGIQNGGSTVAWVGQGAPKPVSKLSFTSGSLGFAKAAGIVVITQELARFSSPSAELKVRDDLTNQMVYFLDQQFIDPGVAAVANVSPASILNGASNVRQQAAAWTTMATVITDVKALLAGFTAQEISLEGAYWVMTPDVALLLSMLMTAGGENFAFPNISLNGGTLFQIPVIVSNAVPHSTSAGSIVALVVPSQIYLADDGAVAIDSSTEASLQMDTAPTVNSATPTATSLVSMFQTNSIAIRCERVINWVRARDYGVGYIDNVH